MDLQKEMNGEVSILIFPLNQGHVYCSVALSSTASAFLEIQYIPMMHIAVKIMNLRRP